jgi:hypothetical protein
MQSKGKPSPTKAERAHIERVTSTACVICDAPPPSECHEIEQGQWFTSVALCADCHRGKKNGLHGERAMWRVTKHTELSALNETLRRVLA